MSGTLYGVGVGPGDPELMTLKAARLIGAAQVVAYPAPVGGDSFARSIAAAHLRDGVTELRIDIPMDAKRFPAQDVYDAAAVEIAAHLDAGRDVVVLCEGDPFFYGSFMYLFARLRGDQVIEVVPGVTSVTTVAARAGRPLSARNEVLTVLPATLSEAELTRLVAGADAMAIMKLGRNLPKVRRVLEGAGLTGSAIYVERASLPNECCLPLADAPETAPYFSMILASKGGDPWLT